MDSAVKTKTDNLHVGARDSKTQTHVVEDDEDRGRIPLHPRGGSDLRLLARFDLNTAHILRTNSYAQAQAIRAKRR